jgi:kinesin family protein 11
LKEKMKEIRGVYVSHIEAVQNVVRLHMANSDASLEELSSAISSHGHSIEEVCFNCSNNFLFYF